MSIETRHTEKSILFALLEAQKNGSIEKVISQLEATMEPEDVELVHKKFNDNLV